MSSIQFVLLGIAVLITGLVVSRSMRRAKALANRNPADEARRDFVRAEQGQSATINRLELRLYDFAREMEGRLETRMALLDQLIAEADREIARMQELLTNTGGGPNNANSQVLRFITPGEASRSADTDVPTADVARMLDHLRRAGLDAQQIAVCLGQPIARIRRWLENCPEGGGGDRRAA
ncbi:MAG TPA: hypothetical protein VHB77_00795 [Planctomycetaceae bacterium]|nr:hypothetical protein [Planctomycetaceae bacterium]